MTIFSDIWYVAKRELIKFTRARVRFAVNLIQPLIWLGLMGNMMKGMTNAPGIGKMLGTGNYLAFMTPGIIVMTVLFAGAFGGISIVWDRRIGYLEKLMAAPIARGSIAFGKMLSTMLQVGTQVVVVMIIATILGVHIVTGLPGCVVILLIAMVFSLILSGFSLSVSATMKTMETLMALVNLVTLPLMFASSALFPLKVMPGWLAAVAKFNPVTYAVRPVRELTLYGWNWAKMAPSLGIVVGLAIVFLLIAQFTFQRATTE
ncbi:MAG TPA: ABC transporter [Candidatus Acetothermia bacterium]|nr:ABC transporter [Candidatus Acetothermia bacterium]